MKQPVKLGALSLLLAVVVVCLVTLGVLTLATAHADVTLAQRYAQNVQETYLAEAAAQQWLAQVAQAMEAGTALPNGTVREGGLLCAEVGAGGTKYISAAVDPAIGTPFTVVRWQMKSTVQRNDTLNNLYTG